MAIARPRVIIRFKRASLHLISAVRKFNHAVTTNIKTHTRTVFMRNPADLSYTHFECSISTARITQWCRITLGNPKEDRDYRILVVCVLARIKQGVSARTAENQILTIHGFVLAVGIHTNTPFKRSSRIHTYFGLPYQPVIGLTYIF